VAYKVQLPVELRAIFPVFHVSQLKKCLRVPEERVEVRDIKLKSDLVYEEKPVAVVDRKERVTPNRVVKFYKVLWSNHGEEDATWETEDYLCGHHAAPRTLVGNTFRQRFYWPTAIADAIELVHLCHGSQFYAKQTHLPAHTLQMIPITWLFAVWGLGLMGPLQRTIGAYMYLLVAINMFSK